MNKQRIPPQKISSFKGEKNSTDRKKQQNWFQRQFSRQMSKDYDSSDDGQYATAVAAAAFAINSEEAKLAEEKKIREGLEKFPTKTRSKKEEVSGQQETGKISRKSTSKESSKEDKKSSERVGQKPEKAPSRVPSIRRTPTFAEQVDTRPTRAGGPKSKADGWMEVEMAKIQNRYEKMKATILSWEEEKKKKARHHLDKREAELERRRAIILQQHRVDMNRIEQVVRGAKAKVEEKRRNEQLKAKEKAKKIRETGKVPTTGLCC